MQNQSIQFTNSTAYTHTHIHMPVHIYSLTWRSIPPANSGSREGCTFIALFAQVRTNESETMRMYPTWGKTLVLRKNDPDTKSRRMETGTVTRRLVTVKNLRQVKNKGTAWKKYAPWVQAVHPISLAWQRLPHRKLLSICRPRGCICMESCACWLGPGSLHLSCCWKKRKSNQN